MRDPTITAELRPVETRYLRDEAFHQIREAIVGGTLAPGQPVVIDDLAATLGLSTMPVREYVRNP